MKTPLWLCAALGLAAVGGPAEAAPRRVTPTPTEAPAEAKIPGVTIPRGDKFLGLAIRNGNFQLSFYDADKKPTEPDVKRAALRWPVVYRLLDEHTLLTPAADGKSLTSSKVVKGPYYFKVYLTLLPSGTDDETGESFVVDFKPSGLEAPGPTPAPAP